MSLKNAINEKKNGNEREKTLSNSKQTVRNRNILKYIDEGYIS